ncbi:MAG: tetratricopeptide repeat protein [bacterium]|nr:tetratricopeptide repeat protein [bacterium]
MKATKFCFAALLAMTPLFAVGCAGNWGQSKPQLVAMGSPRPQPYTGIGSRVTGAFTSVAQKVSGALTPDKTVIKAPDAIDLDSQPENVGPELYITAGGVHESRGNWEDAKKQYELALGEDPQNFKGLMGLARLHDRQSDYESATGYYRQAISHHPTNAQAHHDLGICHARKGDTTSAIAMMERAVQLDPQNVRFRNNAAQALIQQGNTRAAIDHLAAVHPIDAAHYNAGVLLYRSGQTNQARDQFQQALAANPRLAGAQQMLARLETSTEVIATAPQRFSQPTQR